MNIKAMAKSKRSQTKHNQPRKPHHLKPTPAPVPPSSSSSPSPSSSFNKQPSNPKKGKKDINPVVSVTDEPPSPSLPSNWDRYEEEGEGPEFVEDGEEEYEEEVLDWSSGRPRVVTAGRMSKGANLIVPVKEPRKYPSISNHYFFDDFNQGFASTRGVQSDSTLTLDRDDDFLSDDEATSRKEHGQDEKMAERQKVKKEDTASFDAAEIELNALLNSFSETKFSDSPATQTEGASLFKLQGASLSCLNGNSADHQAPVPHLRSTSRPEQIASNLNDDLDDLLERTSTLHSKDSLLQSIEIMGTTADDATHESPFQPGFHITSSTLDDELDNLLNETSKFMSTQSTTIQ